MPVTYVCTPILHKGKVTGAVVLFEDNTEAIETRQTLEAASLARTSRETYKLFKAQFEAGQRPVMDVVSIYEELVKREQDHIDAKYEVVLIQLALARDMGLLADGDKI